MSSTAIGSAIASQFQFLSVLKIRDFRLFWLGLLAEVSGQSMMTFTIGWLAFDLTGSPLALGYVQLASAGPRILLSQFGGVLADRLDQRQVVTVTQTVAALTVGLLAYLVLTGQVRFWHLIVLPMVNGMALAFDNPARQALYPQLLPDRARILDAVPLVASTWQLARVIAPAVAGYIIAFLGAGNSFLLAAFGFATMGFVVRFVRVSRVRSTSRGNVLQNLAEGARYAWGNPTFRLVIGMTYLSSIFGMGYLLMMPIFAKGVLGVGPDGLGLMLSAGGIGAVMGSLAGPRLIRRVPVGKMLVVMLFLFGLLLAVFAFNRSFAFSLPLLSLLGLTSLMFLISAESMVQALVEDHVRGRVMAFVTLTWTLNPLGAALLSAVANFTSAPTALAAGATVVMLSAVVVGLSSKVIRNLGPIVVRPAQRPAETGTSAR
ncbi:MAG: MFS transporter [Candidatus Latescibacteria bacterium]|nr:MFS transporter [Candidatus Latescibacterota bacterium]